MRVGTASRTPPAPDRRRDLRHRLVDGGSETGMETADRTACKTPPRNRAAFRQSRLASELSSAADEPSPVSAWLARGDPGVRARLGAPGAAGGWVGARPLS